MIESHYSQDGQWRAVHRPLRKRGHKGAQRTHLRLQLRTVRARIEQSRSCHCSIAARPHPLTRRGFLPSPYRVRSPGVSSLVSFSIFPSMIPPAPKGTGTLPSAASAARKSARGGSGALGRTLLRMMRTRLSQTTKTNQSRSSLRRTGEGALSAGACRKAPRREGLLQEVLSANAIPVHAPLRARG